MGLASSKRLASTPVTRAFCGAGAACAAFGLAPPLAHAQIEGLRSGNAPIAECDAGNECFTLLGVTLEGAQAIPARELAQHYEPYLAHAVSARDLAMIADAITAHYRSRGYFLSRAIVPPQDAASGLARIVVLEGRISEVVIEGPGARQAAPHLRGLDHQPIANLTDLDCRLALASDTPDEARDRLAQWKDLTSDPLFYPPSVGIRPEQQRENLDAIFATFGTGAA